VLHLQHDAITVVTEGGNGEEVSGIVCVYEHCHRRGYFISLVHTRSDDL